MKASLISLDMLLALPLLLIVVTLLFEYAYASENYLSETSVQTENILSLYINSSGIYNQLSSSAALNVTIPMYFHTPDNGLAYLEKSNNTSGCALSRACRVVVISGRAYTLVFT